MERRLFGEWDDLLHRCEGPQWLAVPAVAGIVQSAFRHFDGKTYDLIAYCIMPNHAHLVISPLADPSGGWYKLPTIMHSIKGYSARFANAALRRSGSFWQHESYDHYVRDSAELLRIIEYVVSNPVRAGLTERWEGWPWTFSRYDL